MTYTLNDIALAFGWGFFIGALTAANCAFWLARRWHDAEKRRNGK